jgi:hypothetical protein
MPDFTLISYALSQLQGVQFIKWGVCVILTVVLARSLAKQNVRHATLVNDQGQNQVALALFALAKTRGTVALLLWILLCVLMIYRDIEMQIDHVRSGTHGNRAPLASVVPAPPTPAITTPEPAAPNPEKQLDAIKAAYEDAFVSYLILDGCKQSNIRDYEALYLALLEALKPYDSTGKEAGNIIIAASGSYQALYRTAPCEASYLTPVKQNLQQFKANTLIPPHDSLR